MAIIRVNVVVPAPQNILPHFDRLKVYRSVTGRTGTYAEVTTPTTRLHLSATETVYTYTDTSGSDAYYYKSAYYNTVTQAESTQSEPTQGDNDPALGVLSVAELRENFLFGIDTSDDVGREYPESLYEFYIKSAVSWMEHKLDMPLRPLPILDETHDFYPQDYENFMFLEVDQYPLLSVEQVRFQLPGGGSPIIFDDTSLYIEKDSGQIQIIPGMGTPYGMAGASPMRGLGRFLPQAFRVDYTAGFAKGRVPDVIREVVGKIASFGPLNIAGDLVAGAGLAGSSLSIDGLSQSLTTTNSSTNAGYGARLIMYQKEIKDQIPTLLRYYKGVKLRVV